MTTGGLEFSPVYGYETVARLEAVFERPLVEGKEKDYLTGIIRSNNITKIIGYIPVVNVIVGIVRIIFHTYAYFYSSKNKALSAGFIRRGVAEVFLGPFVMIADILHTRRDDIKVKAYHAAQNAQKKAQEALPAKPLSTAKDELTLPIYKDSLKPDDVISHGYGEFVAYREADTKEGVIDFATYQRVEVVFKKYSPDAIIKNYSGGEREKTYANRANFIQTEVNQIDPSLRVSFVPRTLFELIYLRKYIQLEMGEKPVYPKRPNLPKRLPGNEGLTEQQGTEYERQEKEYEDEIARIKAEHYFTNLPKNADEKGVQQTAVRINAVIVECLDLPNKKQLTYKDIREATRRELDFFSTHYKNYQKDRVNYYSWNCDRPTVTGNFLDATNGRGSTTLMAINDERRQNIVYQSVALECSIIAQRALLLYRGSNYQADSVFGKSSTKASPQSHSLSYGVGLFAGTLHDPTACAYHYMGYGKHGSIEDATVIPMPLSDIDSSPFFIPANTSTVFQLAGQGEIFHARTFLWKDAPWPETGMYESYNSKVREAVYTERSVEEINRGVKEYQKKTIVLSPSPKRIST